VLFNELYWDSEAKVYEMRNENRVLIGEAARRLLGRPRHKWYYIFNWILKN
jgi:hypothetical protein